MYYQSVSVQHSDLEQVREKLCIYANAANIQNLTFIVLALLVCEERCVERVCCVVCSVHSV